MTDKQIKLGIVGVGKIVRDQHLPALAKDPSFEVTATASRNASVDGVTAYTNIETMLKNEPELDAVSLCMPPQFRFEAACAALEHGVHVLLEKPPGATVSEVEQLQKLAASKGMTLYATWHSRHAAAVAAARECLTHRNVISARLDWKEDVHKWHPGQEWIWQAGGLGVFDPGINGLSILTSVLDSELYVAQAKLAFPSNKAAPIAAELELNTRSGLQVDSRFDWRQQGGEIWNLEFNTDQGVVTLSNGGNKLWLDGAESTLPAHSEYAEYEAIYACFSDLIRSGTSDVDLRPLKLVADAFLLGLREEVGEFVDRGR